MVNVNKLVSQLSFPELTVELGRAVTRAMGHGVPKIELERCVQSNTFLRAVKNIEREEGKPIIQAFLEKNGLPENTTWGNFLRYAISQQKKDLLEIRSQSLEEKAKAVQSFKESLLLPDYQ